jgi:hypothetical protein
MVELAILAFQALSFSPPAQRLSSGSHCTPSGGRDLRFPLASFLISLTYGWPARVPSTVEVNSVLQPTAFATAITAPSCGQLNVERLASVDRDFLARLQMAVDKFLYSSSVQFRYEQCLALGNRTGSFLTSFFLAAKVVNFAGAVGNLNNGAELWKCVPNDAFFWCKDRDVLVLFCDVAISSK